MSSSLTQNPQNASTENRRLNPAELKIDLLCCGLIIDKSCRIQLDDFLPQGGAASLVDGATGLEIVISGDSRDVWVNAPVREKFVKRSPYRLSSGRDGFVVVNVRDGVSYNARIPRKPSWYDLAAPGGAPMSKTGVLEGTYLSIFLDEVISKTSMGRNGGQRSGNEIAHHSELKSVEDVVETAVEAQRQSGVTLVLLRRRDRGNRSLTDAFPYVKALKENVGILVGLQFPPESDLTVYDEARNFGADHFSFWINFFNPQYFDRYTPPGRRTPGRDAYLRAIEYCSRTMGKGRVSGGIIAGIEPAKDTFKGIDHLAATGAIPLIRILRPMAGTDTEDDTRPCFTDMVGVLHRVYEACRTNNLPIGILPNVHVSALLHPEDSLYLAGDSADGQTYSRWIHTMRQVMRPYYQRRMRKHQPFTKP